MAIGHVFQFRTVESALATTKAIDLSQARGPVAAAIRRAIDVERDFRGFVWWEWFRQNLSQTGTFFAILLGTGGLPGGSKTGTLFTLSLPATRTRLLGTRAATGLAELFTLMMLPSLALPLLAPAVGEHFSVIDVLVHGLCAFTAAALFLNMAIFLSTVFSDVWRPLLISCAIAIVTAFCELAFETIAPGGFARYGVFHAMSAESYFFTGTLPWVGLLVSVLLSALLLFGASKSLARHDF
jgi:hypothetical protein